jgi:hypothetical protein
MLEGPLAKRLDRGKLGCASFEIDVGIEGERIVDHRLALGGCGLEDAA